MQTPFSHTLIPLSVGLRRRLMLGLGAAEHTVRLNGSTIHYYYGRSRRGGPPLLLVHGIADNATTWSATFNQLRSIGPVYALDLPGFGQSDPLPGGGALPVSATAELLARFVEQEVGRPVLLVGNSMGAWIGLRLAAARPELLRGIVALNPGGAALRGRESWQPFIDLLGVPNLAAVRAIYTRMFARHPLRLPLYAGQHGFQQLFSRKAVQHILHQTTEREMLRAAELGELPVPVGIIWGTADRFLPEGSLEFFQHCMPQASWLLLSATGHLPQIERPGHVVAFTRRFAAGLLQVPRPAVAHRQ